MTGLTEIYERYKTDVYRYLLYLTRNQQTAEELTSEVFVAAMCTLSAFQQQCDIKTWLFSIARHKWYEHIRREKRHAMLSDRLTASYRLSPAPDDIVVQGELMTLLHSLLWKQPDLKREVFLRRVEGQSYREIASSLGISESSARVIDFRIRKQFRELLDKEGYTDV